MAAVPADVIIEPDVTPFVWDDFTKTPEMVRAGEEATMKACRRFAQLLKARS